MGQENGRSVLNLRHSTAASVGGKDNKNKRIMVCDAA
jgi:hypothetical protein